MHVHTEYGGCCCRAAGLEGRLAAPCRAPPRPPPAASPRRAAHRSWPGSPLPRPCPAPMPRVPPAAGKAAHWAYKEKPVVPAAPLPPNVPAAGVGALALGGGGTMSSSTASTTSSDDDSGYWLGIDAGHPMLHISPGEWVQTGCSWAALQSRTLTDQHQPAHLAALPLVAACATGWWRRPTTAPTLPLTRLLPLFLSVPCLPQAAACATRWWCRPTTAAGACCAR